MVENSLKKRIKVFAGSIAVQAGPALLCACVDYRKLDLILFGIEIEEQFINLVYDLVGTRVGTVDLVEDHDDREVGFQRFPKDEPCLG